MAGNCVFHDCEPDHERDENSWCCNKQPDGGFICSRTSGHSGEHAACNLFNEHDLARWPNLEETNPVQIDIQYILEQLDELGSKLEDCRSDAQEAYNQAQNAESAAYEAKNYADSAEDYAIDARNQADGALGTLNDMQELIEELTETLKEEQGSEGERNLAADIRKWKKQVAQLLGAGSSHASIAKHLGISEFLVTCIEDELKRERAAA